MKAAFRKEVPGYNRNKENRYEHVEIFVSGSEVLKSPNQSFLPGFSHFIYLQELADG